jgi:hypothetical protein
MTELYREHQKFNQWWMWLVLIIPILLALYASYWVYVGSGDWTAALITWSVGGLTAIVIAMLTLRTTITTEGIEVAFHPFSKRRIFRSEIEQAFVRKYSPIGEYGGWGYRLGGSAGKAYNISGNQGLQLLLKSGEKLLIGTRHPEALAALMTDYLEADASEEMLELKALEAQKLRR